MALIVVCEDDDTTRILITAVLTKAGHQVEAFDNGMKGYARLLEGDVELLVSDVQMPGKDGFELVSQVREDALLAEMPCILLTSLQERAHMRIGMTSGADDYVTKPFIPSELIDAVNVQLKRAVQRYALHVDETLRSVDAAVGQRTNELMAQFERKLRRELQSRWERSDTACMQLNGSMIACAFLQQEVWLRALSSSQMADLVRHFYNKVADSTALFNAEHLQFVGNGLLIVFDAQADTLSVDHASRAQRLLQAMDAIRSSMQAYVLEHLTPVCSEPLPMFTPCLALHKGQLSLGKLDGVAGGIEQLVPVGQDVQLLSKLLKAGQALGWSVLFSEAALAHWTAQKMNPSIADYRKVKIGTLTLRIHRGA